MSIKSDAENTKDSVKEYQLEEAEFNYLMNINDAKNNNAQEYNRVMSAFLHYIASSRLGYAASTDLQFELDFADEKRNIKVTVLEPETAIDETPTVE